MIHPVIREIIQHGFPPGTEVIEGKSQQAWHYLVIYKGNHYPRWLIPVDHRYGLSVLSQWQPYDLKSRLQWMILRVAYRFRWLVWLPMVESVFLAIPPGATWQHLGWQKEVPPIPTIFVGTPTLLQKAVIFLSDKQQAKTACVAKIPLKSRTADWILAEAHFLRKLQSAELDIAPGSLHLDEESGVTVQEYKAGRPTQKQLTEAHIDFLIKLIRQDTTTFSEQCERMLSRIEALALTTRQRDWFFRKIQSLQSRTPLPAAYVHGDFMPWNLKIILSGTLFAVDWEEAIEKGLPFYDLIHFFLMSAHLEGRSLNILPAMLNNPLVRKYLDACSISHDVANKIFKVYLLIFWCNRLEQEGSEAADRYIQLFSPLLEAEI